ncbi:MAG: plastocyanin/azurin family copper-binding protein [Candidatus Promineifilaceae bacterium]
MKNAKFLTALFLAFALLLAACGGDGTVDNNNGAVDNANEDGGAAGASLSFEATDELRFVPDAAEASAGAEVEVTLNNTGALEHTWTLVGADVDVAAVTSADAIAGADTGTVAGGGSQTISLSAPEAGTYQFVCTVPGHAAGGMVGTLTVN